MASLTKNSQFILGLLITAALILAVVGTLKMQPTNQSASLTSYSAADASAYRWDAIGKNATSLTSYSAADASTYRWEAIGKASANLSSYNASEAADYYTEQADSQARETFRANWQISQDQLDAKARAIFRANWQVLQGSSASSVPVTGK